MFVKIVRATEMKPKIVQTQKIKQIKLCGLSRE